MTTRSAGAKRICELPGSRRRRGVDGQAFEQDVHRARAGNGENVPAQLAQRIGPFGRFDRDAVASAQPERKDGGGRHGAEL